MDISLNYLGRTGGGTRRIYCAKKYENIVVHRFEKSGGEVQISRERKQTNQLLVSPEGTVSLELTRLNAAFIQGLCATPDFELTNEDEQVFIDQILAGKIEEEVPVAPPKRGRPKTQPKAAAPAAVPPAAAGNVVSV